MGVEAPCARRQQPCVGVRAHVGWPALLAAVERPLALKGGGGSVGDVGGRDDDLAEAAAVVRPSAQADLATAHLRLEVGLGIGIGLGIGLGLGLGSGLGLGLGLGLTSPPRTATVVPPARGPLAGSRESSPRRVTW